MTTTYSAKLIAFLSVEKYEVPFETFLDLSEQKAYRIGVLGQSSVEEHIKVLVSLTSVKWSNLFKGEFRVMNLN